MDSQNAIEKLALHTVYGVSLAGSVFFKFKVLCFHIEHEYIKYSIRVTFVC